MPPLDHTGYSEQPIIYWALTDIIQELAQ